MLSEAWIQIIFVTGVLSAGLCAYLGNFILMKNMSFLSIALSEMAALGVALGFLLQFWFEPLHHFGEEYPRIIPNTMAFLSTLIAILFFWKQSKKGQQFHEGVIGCFYASSAALTIVLISKNPLLEARGSLDLVGGNLLYCSEHDLALIAGMVFVVGVIHFICFRNFLFVSFDPETAQAQGLKTDRWELLLMMTIGLCISLSMSITGVLFVFASLVIPGLTALNLFQQVKFVFISSILFAFFSVFLGLIASTHFDLPTSPAIICFYGVFYFLTRMIKKGFAFL